jgi:ATP-dependent DNA ligase I
VLLAELVATSRAVGDEPGRLAKIGRLADLLGRLAPDEVPLGVAWLSGELREGRVGVGAAALREALSEAGAPARTPGVGLRELDATLGGLRDLAGRGSARARVAALRDLFARATAAEREFLGALLLGGLRQGALEGVMLEAVARAASLPAADVRRAAMLAGDLGAVARSALERGAAGLADFRLELFRPLQPMLAQTAEDPAAALASLGGHGAFEWKLDGARIQLHRVENEVRVFSRAGLDVTAAVPELAEAARALPARRLVLDGEALALRPDGRPRPFQVTMRRFGRRLDVEALRGSLALHAFFFDCLHRDGDDLLGRSAEERWRALADAVPAEGGAARPGGGAAVRVPRLLASSAGAAQAFLDEALGRGHEGVVAKAVEAPYEAGRRGSAWLKLKPTHTLDLVVLAAEWGSGRRRGLLSNLHLGARDPTKGGFVMLGKTFKGLTDELLAWQTQRLAALAIGSEGPVVHVRPELVVEIAFDGVQASPQYPGGLALRFARVRRYRPDKRPEEADGIDRVRAIHAGGPEERADA